MWREVGKIVTYKNEEIFHLKNHDEKLLMQMKKLKNNKKSLDNKLKQLIEREASKSSNVKIQVEEKGTIIDPFNLIAQKSLNSIEVKKQQDVVVQMTKIPSEDTTCEENHLPKLS